MYKTEFELKYELCKNDTEGMPVIVVAAGSSSRMQGTNKQFLELGGIPVIIKTLMRFEKSPEIKNIILVVRDEDLFNMQLLTEKYQITKLTDIVCGGKTRQESVLKGFNRVSEDDECVLIHDGARPLVDERIISDVAQALKKHSAVTCAVKVKDTVKQIDQNGKVVKTLDRDALVAVQTPQGVNVADYLTAVNKAGDVSIFTDDTSLMEAAGFEVYTVEGSYKNIKITTPEDIEVARAFGEDGL